MYVVIDTNVIVSALLKEESNPRKLLDLVLTDEIIPIITHEILSEYKDVLKREKFGFDVALIEVLFEILANKWKYIETNTVNNDNYDKGDLFIYSAYIEHSKIDTTYLVTGNLKHFPTEKNIINPKMMVDIIRNSN